MVASSPLWFGAMACRPWLSGPASFSSFILKLPSSISCLFSTPHSGHAPSHTGPLFMLFPVLGCLSSSHEVTMLGPRAHPWSPSFSLMAAYSHPDLDVDPRTPSAGTCQPVLAAPWQGGPSCLLSVAPPCTWILPSVVDSRKLKDSCSRKVLSCLVMCAACLNI